MVAQDKLYTIGDLLQMPDDGKRYEQIRGVIVEMTGSDDLQTVVAGWLLCVLGDFVEAYNLGWVTGADGVHYLAPGLGRSPDVGLISKQRLPPPLPTDAIPLTPDLAVEVVSPNDRATEVRDKVNLFLTNGTKMVWVIYPDLERADVFVADDQSVSVAADGNLDGGTLIPGFSISLQRLFQGLK